MRRRDVAGQFQEGAVLHTGRTDRLAGAAPEASIDMTAEGIGLRRQTSFHHRPPKHRPGGKLPSQARQLVHRPGSDPEPLARIVHLLGVPDIDQLPSLEEHE